MSLREACKHGRYETHHVKRGLNSPYMCDGRRVLSDAEALRALLFKPCEECEGEGQTFKPLGTMAHDEASPHYLTPAEGFWKGERLPPGRYRVGSGTEWIDFDLRGEDDVLTNAVYLPEVEDWPFDEVPLHIMWTCPSCGGSGQTPKDGVAVVVGYDVPDQVIIPLSMLEGDRER